MRITLSLIIFIIIISSGLFIYQKYSNSKPFLSPVSSYVTPTPKPLEKYTYDNLKMRQPKAGDIFFDKILKSNPLFDSWLFNFTTNGKKVTGLANIPVKKGTYPVIVMLRGFVDRTIYETGIGTQRAGEVFASNGFITLAPDFLGYGGSASPSANVMEERFESYTTILDLLSSINRNKLLISDSSVSADINKMGLWAHSNGGQIALSVLEATGKSYPTVLWAPVSKPFPYSILYYTDEFEDHGKALRKVVADFEEGYDSEKYSLTNYMDRINAPIQLHQGLNDDAVPFKWSDELYKSLKKMDIKITYFTYPNADHNLMPDGWNLAISRSLEFYHKFL